MSLRSVEAIAVAVTGVTDLNLAEGTLSALAGCERDGPLHVVIALSPGAAAVATGQRQAWREVLRGASRLGEDDEVWLEVLPPLPGMREEERRNWAVRRALDLAPLAIAMEAGELPERDALHWFAFGRDALLRRGKADVLAAMSKTLAAPAFPRLHEFWDLRERVDRAGLINRYQVGPWAPPGAFATDRAGWERVRPVLDVARDAEVVEWTGLASAQGLRCAWPVVSRSRRSGQAARWHGLVSSGESWLKADAFALADDDDRFEILLANPEAKPRSPRFRSTIQRLHEHLRPELYVEIGVRHGSSFRLASCRGIGIDPNPLVPDDVLAAYPNLELFPETSDAFYARSNLAEVFGRPVDLTFIDGLHQFDQVLRDFINAERWASRDGAIVLHDVLPMNQQAATHPRRQVVWTGDVWRIVDCLAERRPDLHCLLLDHEPSGLLVVTGLDPESSVLPEHYEEIVGQLPSDESEEYLAALRRYLVTTARTARADFPWDPAPAL